MGQASRALAGSLGGGVPENVVGRSQEGKVIFPPSIFPLQISPEGCTVNPRQASGLANAETEADAPSVTGRGAEKGVALL
nr:MAG TPA: hypothetical protein [Caudoviricetes sp.]